MSNRRQTDEGEAHPYEGEPPHDHADEDAEDVQSFGATRDVHPSGFEDLGLWQKLYGNFAQLLDAKSALSEGPNR